MVGSLLAGLATGGLSNLVSEWHADKQQKREKELMDYQNNLNKANALDAYRNTVQGMKMAGLNPALAQDTNGTAAAPVSKGNVGMAENVEFDPSTMLLEAQRDNLQAQTEKTEAETAKISGVDTKNVIEDTNLKVAQRLLGDANKAKVDAETTQINNLNKAFTEENEATKLFGQTMAQEWQKEPWYNQLTKGQKMVLDDIANGNFDLTIGFLNALNKSIQTDGNMNETIKNNAENALNRAIFKAQLENPKVKDKLRDMPIAKYNELVNSASKMATEQKLLNFNYKWEKDKKNVWEHNDPDKLYADYQKDPSIENAAKWLVSAARNTGTEILKSTAPAAVHGSAMKQGLENQSSGNSKLKGYNTPSGHPKSNPFETRGWKPGDKLDEDTFNKLTGVQNMNFNKKHHK